MVGQLLNRLLKPHKKVNIPMVFLEELKWLVLIFLTYETDAKALITNGDYSLRLL